MKTDLYPNNQTLRSATWAMLILMTLFGCSLAMAADDPPEELWVPPKTFQPLPEATAQKPSAALRSYISKRKTMPQLRLNRLSDEQMKLKSAQTDRGRTKAGFTRDIPDFQTREQTQSGLNWEATADGGLISLLSFSSPSALALRLGLKVTSLPDAAELRFFSHQSSQGDVVKGAEIMQSVRKNLEAGDPEEQARLYWSPVETGETVGVEIYLPPGTYPEQVDVTIPQLTHIFLSPGAGFDPYSIKTTSTDLSIRASQSCNVDVRCAWPTWQNQSNAVGQMIFNDGGSYYICTGTLMNDTASSGTPYFLSADHCISTQTVASSLQTRWFWYSTACNSGITNPNYQTTSGGADLLYHSNATDTSFMRLRTTPPIGTLYSGWTTSKQAVNTLSTGLHNPNGDLQKISSGQVSNYFNCTAPTNGSFSCSSNADGNYANIIWSSGTTEGGSSGSGIFTNSGQYLFGQLYGGNSSCTNLSGTNFYGRFDKAYSSGNLGQWLASQFSLSVSKSGTGTGTVTSNPVGINCGSVCSANFSSGSNVTLTATAASGSTLASWTGCTSSSGTTCNVTMTAAKNVTATLNLQTFALTVTKTGSGTVTSNPAGINCGATCVFAYASGQSVTLTPTPASGFYFSSWSGACTGSEACIVSMDAAKSVTANFTAIPAGSSVLSVTKTGLGSVTSLPVGIDCSGTCNATFANGTSVTLTAAPVTGYYFAGWGGACSGQGTCTLTINSNQTATANFAQIPSGNPLLTITVTGGGTVATNPSGLTCSTTCSYPFPTGTAVSLIPSANIGQTFMGWAGEGCIVRSSCLITMDSPKTVGATFQNTYTLIMPAINLLLLGD